MSTVADWLGKRTYIIMSSNRVALITGAAQGIGLSAAYRLAHDGFDVALLDIPSKRLALEAAIQEIVERTSGRQPRAIYVLVDISSEADVVGAVEDVAQKLGTIDVLVANAGILSTPGFFTDVTLDSIHNVMDVNVYGTFLTFREVAKYFVAQGKGGKLIAMSSSCGVKGVGILTEYSISKWAIRGLVQAAASGLAHYGITANAIAPGPVDTKFWMDAKPAVAALAGVKEEDVWKLSPVPIGRSASTTDVSNLIAFLASKDSDYMTGQTLNVDGGLNFS